MNIAATYFSGFAGMGTEFDFWLAGLGLILTSFLVEDAAIAAGVALAADGMMSWEGAFLWVALGITMGDLLLFGAGFGARSIPWLRKRFIDSHSGEGMRAKLQTGLVSAVFVARAVPGLRLATYTLCGFLNVPFLKFVPLVFVACFLWTAGLFWLGSTIGHPVAAALGIPPALAVAGVVIVIALLFPVVQFVLRRRGKSS